MAVDTSIYNALAPRVKSVAEFDAEAQDAQMRKQNMLMNALGIQQRQQEMAQAQQMRDEAARFGGWLGTVDTKSPDFESQAMQRFPLAAPAALKGFAERRKETALALKAEEDAAKDKQARARNMFEYSIQGLQTMPSAEAASQYINQGVQRQVWGMQEAQSMIASMQDQLSKGKPYEIWRREQLKAITAAKDQLPQTQTRNLGGTTDTLSIDPFSGAVSVLNSAKNTQSPDNVATNARIAADSAANRAQADRHFNTTQQAAAQAVTYQQDADGNFVALPTKVVPGAVVRGVPVMGPAGVQQLQGKSAGLTEDQGKATGWLVQASNAWKNMQNALASNPGAAKPGFNDALSAVPSMGVGGALANMMRGKDRQKFLQASSSLSEALLRAATGAGINMHEAEQKVRELTPVFGDSDENIKQKMDSIPIYIESLKVRAGPGAKKANALGADAPKSVNWADLKSVPFGYQNSVNWGDLK